jgi:anti-sigma factor RsiW
MRDHTYDPGCEAARDLLPELLRGRRDGAERERAERHLASCDACARELAMLHDARGALVAGAPAFDVAAVAAAVRAATAPRGGSRRPGVGDTVPARVPPRTAAPARWRVRRSVVALVASVLVAVGAGAVWRAADAPVGADTPGVASESRSNVPGRSTAVAPGLGRVASAEPGLGERFDDLSDEELQAVVAAVEARERGLPTAEPEADLLAADVEGG